MYAGVGSRINSSNAESHDIPEWKRLLIMKKRASVPPPATSEESKSEQTRSNFRGPVTSESGGRRTATTSSSLCDNLPPGHTNKFSMLRTAAETTENEKVAAVTETQPETVIRTIGNIKVELRSVYKSPMENGADDENAIDRFLTSPLSEPTYPDSEEEEDLQYGPGIVDRLRARFLNLGLKNRRKPVVRKFSSLENLSGGSCGMFRSSGLQYRGEKRFNSRSAAGGNPSQRIFPSSNFKKAQSMETLLVGGSADSNPFPHHRINARIFARTSRNQNDKTLSPISRYTDSAPRFDGKVSKRIEYNRQGSGSNINEDELPKPDTVKHFKRIFESPTTDKTCHAVVNQTIYEKGLHNRAVSNTSGTSSATKLTTSAISAKKSSLATASGNLTSEDDFSAKSSAKTEVDSCPLRLVNGPPVNEESHKIEPGELSPRINDSLSPCRNVELEISPEEYLFISSPALTPTVSEEPSTPSETDVNKESAKTDEVLSQESHVEESPVPKVTGERLPQVIESPSYNSDVDSPQGSQVFIEPERAEANHCVTAACEEPRLEEEEEESTSSLREMVIASTDEGPLKTDDAVKTTVKKPNWQKPPPPTTSIVFDFRGKDVKPQISLNPAPFGCRPAKVKKRAGSPPRGEVMTINGDNASDDDEDWDEMDIGADLPAISGILFAGENVKVGRGALLEKRNKKLSIQFNDDATSMYEYPCESPSPLEENGHAQNLIETQSNVRPLKSSIAISNSSSANTALSNYMPHGLSSEEFELGISPPPPPVHRRHPTQPARNCESPTAVTHEIVPADPEDSSGWSSAETADILF